MDQSYFPRGGAKEKPVIQYKQFVFEKKPFKKSKKKSSDKRSNNSLDLPTFVKFGYSQSINPHFHLNDLEPGFQCLCAVNNIKKNRIIVNLPFGKIAAISINDISGPFSNLLPNSESTQVLSRMFYIGQLLSCKVTKFKKPYEKYKRGKISVSVDPKVVNENLHSGLIKKHSLLQMAVASVEDHGYCMECGVSNVMAFLPFREAAKYAKKVLNSPESLEIGTIVWCYVTESKITGFNTLQVTINPGKTSLTELPEISNTLWPGCIVESTITKVYKDRCCELQINGTDIRGSVCHTLDYTQDPSIDYSVGSTFPASVISYDPKIKVYNFSFSHHVGRSMAAPLCTKNIKFNTICKATITHVGEVFAYVKLYDLNFRGMIPIKAAIRKNNSNNHHVDRDIENESESDGDKALQKMNTFSYKAGDNVLVSVHTLDMFSWSYVCYIKHSREVLEKEVKLELDPLDIKEEISDDSDEDKDFLTNKIKNEYDLDIEIKDEPVSDEEIDDFNNDTIEEETVEDLITEKRSKKRQCETTPLKTESNKKLKKSTDDDSIEAERSAETSKSMKNKINLVNQLSLKDVDSSFIWDATPDDLARVTSKNVEEFNEESDEDNAPKKPLTKKQKKVNELEKEKKLREKEEELLKALEEPKCADHYERLILSRPDDSKVWIKYMAHYLEATEIEKARTVGKRALKLINQKKEQERLNVWFALLNLEHLYGSKETFKEKWQEALQYNDDYKVNCKVLDMYAEVQNSNEVNFLVRKMVKKYRENSECWFVCLSALMSTGLEAKARDLLQRALQALPAKAHVTLLSKFARLESAHGHNEEGQALFDNLLTTYPARVDLWFVYLDMLIKLNQFDLARQVFERATSQKMPAKKMKSVYKKWLEFEEKNGNEETAERVRKSAMEYVEQATKQIGM